MPPTKNRRSTPAKRAATLYPISVAVVVSDRKKATDWYTKVLGLSVVDTEDHWVTVGQPGHEMVLHLCQTTEYDPNGKLEPGNSGILLKLPGKDFAATCDGLKERGVEFSQEPRKDPWGWWAMVRDPDGNEHCVMPAD